MRWVVIALVVLLASAAEAGSITVTVNATPDQELALTLYAQRQADAVTKRNAEAMAWNAANPTAPPKPMTPVLTREQWLADQVSTVLTQLSTQHRAKVLGAAQAAFETATPAQKVAVCAALGLTGRLAECP